MQLGREIAKTKKMQNVYLPDLTQSECRVKCRDRLTCLSDNTQNLPTFGPTNVGWMSGEMSEPFDRGLTVLEHGQ